MSGIVILLLFAPILLVIPVTLFLKLLHIEDESITGFLTLITIAGGYVFLFNSPKWLTSGPIHDRGIRKLHKLLTKNGYNVSPEVLNEVGKTYVDLADFTPKECYEYISICYSSHLDDKSLPELARILGVPLRHLPLSEKFDGEDCNIMLRYQLSYQILKKENLDFKYSYNFCISNDPEYTVKFEKAVKSYLAKSEAHTSQ